MILTSGQCPSILQWHVAPTRGQSRHSAAKKRCLGPWSFRQLLGGANTKTWRKHEKYIEKTENMKNTQRGTLKTLKTLKYIEKTQKVPKCHLEIARFQSVLLNAHSPFFSSDALMTFLRYGMPCLHKCCSLWHLGGSFIYSRHRLRWCRSMFPWIRPLQILALDCGFRLRNCGAAPV